MTYSSLRIQWEIEAAYQLVQTFLQMMRERGGQHLQTWLQAAEASHFPEFEAFAAGVRQDQAAIFAGLTLPWRSGQTEGQITRLKLLKRSRYGRAKFDLLRLRVLHRAEDSQKKNETSKTVSRQQHEPASVPRSGEKRGNSQHTTLLISEVAEEPSYGLSNKFHLRGYSPSFFSALYLEGSKIGEVFPGGS